jgi:hypothetical protein
MRLPCECIVGLLDLCLSRSTDGDVELGVSNLKRNEHTSPAFLHKYLGGSAIARTKLLRVPEILSRFFRNSQMSRRRSLQIYDEVR